MGSTMHTLREIAEDPQASPADILEKALFQATVLRQKPIQQWLRRERDGYAADEPVPDYRRAEESTLLAWRPGAGWIQAPVDEIKIAGLTAAELRTDVLDLVRKRERIISDGGVRQELEGALHERLQAETNLDTRLALAVPARSYVRILDTLRLAVRVWSDRLIEAGIEGHGSAFTSEEKKLAQPIGDQLEEILAEATALQAELPPPTAPGFMARLFGRA